jgi:hypothetical protein
MQTLKHTTLQVVNLEHEKCKKKKKKKKSIYQCVHITIVSSY